MAAVPDRHARRALDFVQQRINSGVYTSVGEIVRTAFDLLERRERLLEMIDAGTAQFLTGEFTEYDGDSFERFFGDIEAEAQRLRRRSRRQKYHGAV
jgi:Arc/MetJ-type ribon-helix-helix transcriptional regulator